VEKKVKMGYFGNKFRNWGPPRGPGIAPSLSIIFPILNISKADVMSLLKAHLPSQQVRSKVKMGYFGIKWRYWGEPRGPGISPSVSNILAILNLAK
jgi:hypothetical protein